MTDSQKPQLLLGSGDPPKMTYGSPMTIKFIRFWMHMKIINEANERFFNGSQLRSEESE